MNDELKGALNERLKSAIFGTFSIYLFLVNWRVFVYLFSDLKAGEKIQLVNDYLEKDGERNAGIALGITLITLVVVPLSKNAYDKLLMWWNFGTDSYSDKLARQREVLDKNGADKIVKMLTTKNTAQLLSNNAQKTTYNIDVFINNNTNVLNEQTKKEFNNVKLLLAEIMQQANGIMVDIDGFQTEVNRIVRVKK